MIRTDRPPRGPIDDELAASLFEHVDARGLLRLLELGAIDGLWISRLCGEPETWVSPRFCEVLGHPPGTKLSSEQLRSLVLPEDMETAQERAMEHLADLSKPYDAVVRYRHCDGSLVWVRSRGITTFDDDGRPDLLVGVHTDVTAEMRSHERLSERFLDLESSSALLELLDATTAGLQRLQDPAEVVQSLVDVLGRVVGDRATIVMQEGPKLTLVSSSATDPVDDEAMRDWYRDGIDVEHGGPIGEVIRTGEPVLVELVDAARARRHLEDVAPGSIVDRPPNSMISVPWERSDGRRAAG